VVGGRDRRIQINQLRQDPIPQPANSIISTPAEAVAVIWSLSGPDQYTQLVFERGWTPSRYEEWLGDAAINMLLEPAK
jgi:hypothetical protein